MSDYQRRAKQVAAFHRFSFFIDEYGYKNIMDGGKTEPERATEEEREMWWILESPVPLDWKEEED